VKVNDGATGTIANTASTYRMAEPDTNPRNDASVRGVVIERTGGGRTSTVNSGGSTAQTGADIARGMAILLLLVGLGLAGVLSGRRRRHDAEV
jgi:hypothetical protein